SKVPIAFSAQKRILRVGDTNAAKQIITVQPALKVSRIAARDYQAIRPLKVARKRDHKMG
ncbi:hypothetical protein, partial [Gordonia sp. ABSL49_1]|uniref:hypothetical protein n=1 Tax=Gordonia sp. ABSL49_1 TaxID=2920941 RepID=UPI001F1115A4